MTMVYIGAAGGMLDSMLETVPDHFTSYTWYSCVDKVFYLME